MVIDTSALVAILLGEPDAARYATAMDGARATGHALLFKGNDSAHTDILVALT